MLRNVSLWQLAIIVFAIVILVGWKRLPDMARSMGRSMRVFKSEVDQLHTSPDQEDAEGDGEDVARPGEGRPGSGQRGPVDDRPRPLEGEVQAPREDDPYADPRPPGQERAEAASRRDDDRPAG